MTQKKTFRDYQIVVARYNEDISWTSKYQPNVIIYNKGNYLPKSISLPNVGRESHTYLYHIVNNYNNLADRTIFFQGSCPSFGYSSPGQGGHLYSNYYFEDYIYSNKDIELIITSCVSKNLSQLSIRKGYHRYENIPRPISLMPTNTHKDHWLPRTDFQNFKEYLDKLKKSQKGSHTLESFWKKYISDKHTIPDFLFYNQGAQFSVSRKIIQQHSLEYYQKLLTELEKDINPYQGYYMEWLWPYILNKNRLSPKETSQT